MHTMPQPPFNATAWHATPTAAARIVKLSPATAPQCQPQPQAPPSPSPRNKPPSLLLSHASTPPLSPPQHFASHPTRYHHRHPSPALAPSDPPPPAPTRQHMKRGQQALNPFPLMPAQPPPAIFTQPTHYYPFPQHTAPQPPPYSCPIPTRPPTTTCSPHSHSPLPIPPIAHQPSTTPPPTTLQHPTPPPQPHPSLQLAPVHIRKPLVPHPRVQLGDAILAPQATHGGGYRDRHPRPH